MKIIHISYDVRKRKDHEVTSAVTNLIDAGSKNFPPFTIDLARTLDPLSEFIKLISNNHLIIDVFGLPYGLSLYWTQKHAYKIIKDYLINQNIDLKQFKIIHAHKLTFEGLIGYELAKELKLPFIVTLRQTDIIVLKKKPGALKKYKAIIESCSRFIVLIPSILIELKNILGENYYNVHIAPKTSLIPNIIELNKVNNDSNIEPKYLLSILRMTKESIQRKNLKGLLKGFRELTRTDIKLLIIGDGPYKNTVKKWIRKFSLEQRVILIGKIPNHQLNKYFLEAYAFLLPSFSESFGMVYAEALINGTPIMYSKNYLGFDGFFEGVGVGVNPISSLSIKNGIEELLNQNEYYRKNIIGLLQNGAFDMFSKEWIAKKYCELIDKVINK